VATVDADFAVVLLVSMTATVVAVFAVLLVAMLLVIHRDPASHIDADWPPPPEQ
jgi:hypothetical protein